MKPRRLIITRGREDAVNSLISVSAQVSPETTIYAPALKELLDVTTETHIYQVKLKDALVSSLELQRGKDAELSWVEGYLIMEPATLHGDNTNKSKEVAATAPSKCLN